MLSEVQICENKVFSTVDLQPAFLSIPLEPVKSEITALNDFRKVNYQLIPEYLYFEKITDMLSVVQVYEDKVFSKLDLQSAFWPIPLNPVNSEITTFSLMWK